MKTICLICSPFVVFDSRGNRAEAGEAIIAAYFDVSKATQKVNDMNKSIEIEKGDDPYYIKYISVEE